MRLRTVLAGTSIAFLVTGGSLLFAQEYATISYVTQGEANLTMKEVTDKYFSASFADFNKYVVATLGLDKKSDCKTALDPKDSEAKASWYLLVFPATAPGAKDPALVATLIHMGLQRRTGTLPGERGFCEMVLGSAGDEFARAYVVTEEHNPLQDQLVKAAKMIDFAKLAPVIKEIKTYEDATGGPKTQYYLSSVSVPFRRATISMKGAVTATGPARAALLESATELEASLRTHEARVSACAAMLAGDLLATVSGELSKVKSDPVTAVGRKGIVKQLHLKAGSTLGGTICVGELSLDAATIGRNNAVSAVQDRFDALFSDAPKRIEGEADLHNTPRTHLSLGLVAGGILSAHGDRAKVDSGKLVADPLSGGLSVAAVNVAIAPVDVSTVAPSRGERFRAFLGYVATPAPGVAVGASFLFFRGLSFNVGYAWMLIQEPGNGLHIGDATTDSNPLQRGAGRALFAGFGYNFD